MVQRQEVCDVSQNREKQPVNVVYPYLNGSKNLNFLFVFVSIYEF